MDTPTFIVLVASGMVSAIFFLPFGTSAVRARYLGMQAALVSLVWLLMTLGGEFLFSWAGNNTCSPYLGCVDGFAGFDAFEHFFSGIAAALALLWLCQQYPRLSAIPSGRWKPVLVVIAFVALAAVMWEALEYLHDAVQLDVFHLHLVDWRLHINKLDQPTNSDTMGDLIFAIGGSIIGAWQGIRKRAAS